jgi:FkbM family methyltransferase
MKKVLTSTSICVDVGCHEGAILQLMMKYAPEGTFLAFEPLPHLYQRLSINFAVGNAKVFDVALSDSAGISSFNYVVSNSAYSGLRRRRYDRPYETDAQIEVITDTLDNIFERELITGVSFIKSVLKKKV